VILRVGRVEGYLAGGRKLLCAGKRGLGIRWEDRVVCGQGPRDKGVVTHACGERCV